MAAEIPNVKTVFGKALAIASREERANFLEQACGDDAALRREVDALLESFDGAGSFMDRPAAEIDATMNRDSVAVESSSPPADKTQRTPPTAVEDVGAIIGHFKLLQELGEGGMGTVYMAEQTEPVRRKVALKIIKPGMDSRQVIARFEAERQALALMDHNHIARVLDAGTTESGRPYFVMELVKGVPITKYCDENKLTPRERLELFVPVCQAIQHAHQKGIIHRDIKPSNVLVALYDGLPVPKVIDFGIAKATGQQLTEKTMFTEIGQILGTLEYMSPEQAEMNQLDIDTRSDVYSLGVLLYELLSGSTPITRQQLHEVGFTEMLRTIRESEPPKPSTRLSESGSALPTISAVRRTEPAKLSKLVRGDLDWIVMKALEKDRNRRYETANGLAADINRFLSGEAVEACPPSAGYRFRKFARRNKKLLATGATVALILVASSIVSTSLATWAMKERRVAQSERDAKEQARTAAEAAADAERQARHAAQQAEADTQAFGDFLVEDVLATARPEGVQGGLGIDVTVRQALDVAATSIGRRFPDRPRAEARTRQALGITYLNLDDAVTAIHHLERAVELYHQEFGPDNIDTLFTQSELARALLRADRRHESLRLHERTLERRKVVLEPGHAHTLASMNNVAWGHLSLDLFGDAIPLFEEALAQMRDHLGDEDSDTLICMNSLAIAYIKSDQESRAIPLLEVLVPLRTSEFGATDHSTLNSKNSLAAAYVKVGRAKEAIPLFEEVLEATSELFVANDFRILATMNNLAKAHREAGDLEREETVLRDLLALRRTKDGSQWAALTAKTLADLGQNLLLQKNYAESAKILFDCLEIRQRELPNDWNTSNTQSMLGGVLDSQGKELLATDKDAAKKKFAEAEPLLLAGYEGMKSREAEMPDRIRLTEALQRLTTFYESRADDGDVEKAAEWKAEFEKWQADQKPKPDKDTTKDSQADTSSKTKPAHAAKK